MSRATLVRQDLHIGTSSPFGSHHQQQSQHAGLTLGYHQPQSAISAATTLPPLRTSEAPRDMRLRPMALEPPSSSSSKRTLPTQSSSSSSSSRLNGQPSYQIQPGRQLLSDSSSHPSDPYATRHLSRGDSNDGSTVGSTVGSATSTRQVTAPWEASRQSGNSMKRASLHVLRIRQQPEVARACGFGERDRRVIDPPPILQLDMSDEEMERCEDEETPSPCYVVLADLWDENGTVDVTTFMQPVRKPARRMVGNQATAGTIAFDDKRQKGCFFTFADLSCRTGGKYRIHFRLTAMYPGCSGVGANPPILASVMSDVLTVYPPKDFPGMRRSTPLTQALKNQGVSVPAKKSKLSGSNRASRAESSDDET